MQQANEVKYVGFGTRILANIIDSLFSIIIVYPVFEGISFLYGDNTLQVMLASGAIRAEDMSVPQIVELMTRQIIIFSAQGIALAIVVILFWIYRSATPGKMIMKIKIVDAKSGEKPSKKQLIIRCISYLVSFLPLGFGFIWIHYSKKCQGFHDMIAGTAVVKI